MSWRNLLLSCLMAAVAGPVLGEPAPIGEWSQIRGPARDGRSPETGLLDAWPEGGPARVWRRPLGAGFSGISAGGGRIFTMAAEGGTEYALALDPDTGEELWRLAVGETFPSEFGDGPRSTPTVDGGRVYAFSARGRLAALATGDGEPVWTVEMTEAFASEVPRFGYAGSALIVDDLLLIEAGGPEGKGLAALDKATGETRWTALDGPAAYSSPVVATLGGVRQILFFRRAQPEVVSLLPNGKVFWTHEGLATVIHMPLFVPPDGIFISSTHEAVGVLLRLGMEDGEPVVEEAWRTPRMKNHFNTSVVVDGQIYGFDNAILKSIDAATGEQNWAHRGFGKGSLIEAEGNLVVLADSGRVALVEASPEGFREKGSFQATTGKAWTPPTLAGGRLYLRDQDEIASFDLRAASAAAAKETPAPPFEESPPVDVRAAGKLGVAEILRRYAEARGGRESWTAVRSIEARGVYTSFSIREPFTMLRKRPGLYRFESVMNGGRAVFGSDGSGAWWIEPFLGLTTARRPSAPFARQLERAAGFEPPLLGAAEKGHRVEVAGSGEVNGRATVALGVTLAGGAVETWHLDPATFLEVAVDSKVLDFTQTMDPVDERAYFSDFREVGGIVIPHRVEREYLSRHTVLEIEELTVNPTLDDARFAMPLSEAMEALRPLAGGWRLSIAIPSRGEEPWQTVETTSTITPLLDGALLEERFTSDQPFGPVRVVRRRSWDAERGVYRFTQADDESPGLEVFEGTLEDGRLTVTKASTGTAPETGETEVLVRQVTSDIGPDGFKVEWERSTDGGATWAVTARSTYRRASDGS